MNDKGDRIRVMRVISRMNIGGPAVQVSGLLRKLDSEFFDQRLYTGFCGINEADYLDNIAMDVTAVRIGGLGRRINLKGDAAALVTLIREIREFKPHIIHTHTAKAGFLGRIASIISLQPSIRIHTFHGHLLTGYFNPLEKFLVVSIERFLAHFTHHLLAVGNVVRNDLLNAGVGSLQKFSVMPPGLMLGPLPDKILAQKSLAIDQTSLQCAFIGRVTKIKRPDRFLDLVSEVKKRNVRINFFIAGDGELLAECRKRITKEGLPVVLLGWQSDIEKVLSCADIVILTSDNEGTPLSLIQAGMAALPVVTTRVGSVSEIVLDQITGIITDSTVDSLADALQNLVEDDLYRNSLGANGKQFTVERFGVERLVNDHENLYRKLLNEHQ